MQKRLALLCCPVKIIDPMIVEAGCAFDEVIGDCHASS
jgi:hypothetical protein